MAHISFDASTLEGFDAKLAALDGTALREVGTAAANVVSLTVRGKAIDQTLAELNLTRDYIETRLARTEAKGNSATARVTSQVQGATLQRFGASQSTKPVRWTNARIEAMGHKFGKWPGWTRRTGDEARNIDVDEKAAGVSVDVNRKGDKTIRTAFTMPLKNGNGIGVFKSQTGGRLKPLYGPSVYQVFRRYITTNETAIGDDLRDEYVRRLDLKIQEILR